MFCIVELSFRDIECVSQSFPQNFMEEPGVHVTAVWF